METGGSDGQGALGLSLTAYLAQIRRGFCKPPLWHVDTLRGDQGTSTQMIAQLQQMSHRMQIDTFCQAGFFQVGSWDKQAMTAFPRGQRGGQNAGDGAYIAGQVQFAGEFTALKCFGRRAPIFSSFRRIVVLWALANAVPVSPSRRRPCSRT